MKKINFLMGSSAIILGLGLCLSLMTSCEGPEGLAGKDGADGADGQDANETCKKCHSPSVVDAVSVQFELSKHSYGEAAFAEAGSTTCGPCHLSEAYRYVSKNNTPATFTFNATTNRWVNDYYVAANAAYGEISCFTCHSSLHSTYDSTDFSPLTNTAAVSMTMWKGTKTINLTQNNGTSNLCVKCHQPRPFTSGTSSSLKGDVINYAALVSNQTAVFYDSTAGVTTNVLVPAYRTHTHYGTVGAIYAGVGGIEFPGSVTYSNSPHALVAACQDCHMAPMTGAAGGHTFNVKGNFNGCNVTGCHSTSPITATSAKFTTPRNATKALLNTLAGKLKQDGIDILNRNGDSDHNLWIGLTANNYDGYLNVFDPITNPEGATYNSASFRNPNPGSSWSAAQKATNLTFPKLTLKNVQMGALINFQLSLREYSLGIHNTAYSNALLQNTIDALTAAGF